MQKVRTLVESSRQLEQEVRTKTRAGGSIEKDTDEPFCRACDFPDQQRKNDRKENVLLAPSGAVDEWSHRYRKKW